MSTPPLSGLRVLDLTRYLPGPYATLTLADLGAEVVRIEPPEGDPVRRYAPLREGESAVHAALNRGKRSVVVDLRNEEGPSVLRRLAARADVLVESFRPGVLSRHGLGPERLLESCPRLVYCSVSGYGQDGPYAGRAGHDVGYGALGGFLGANVDEASRPVLPRTQVVDVTAGLLATIGILAALQSRERTGRGQHVDVSLLRAALALMTVPLTRALAGGAEKAPADELAGLYPCYGLYRCRDGRYLALGALEPKFWERLCAALGRPELAADQWATGERRLHARAALAALFASRDRDEWTRTLAEQDLCLEPVLGLDEIAAHPVAGAELGEQPSGAGTLRTVVPPLRFGGAPGAPLRAAPRQGADTRAVLAEAGYSGSEVDRMAASGVLG